MAWPNPFRRRPPEVQPPAVTAAAQPYTERSARNLTRVKQPWQDRARFFGKHLGVVRFGNGLLADLASRCVLVPERLVDAERDEWQPEDNPLVSGLIRRYRNEQADTGELIRAHVWHYQTPGECMQVMDTRRGPVEWSIRSTNAVEYRGRRGWLVKDVPNGTEHDGLAWWAPFEMVQRLWVPDEDWPGLATSPMVGVLADCERYWSLGRRGRRDADSALAMNGLLYTPEEAHRYGLRPDGSPDPISNFDRDLDAVARAAWDDDESPAAVAPFSVHYNKDQPPAWVEVGRALDPRLIESRREALECIARGLSLPQRLITDGPGAGNHWSDWRVAEDEIGVVDGVMNRVCHSDITRTMLRPQLRALSARGQFADDPNVWRVGFDPTPIVVHPDRAATSIALYGLGLLAGEVAVEANGFETSDMMSGEEVARWLLMQQAIRHNPASSDPRLPVGPATTRELPPAPALSSLGRVLAPYPTETASWLD